MRQFAVNSGHTNLTGCILTARDPPSHQHQNLSTQVSQDNILPTVEHTPRNQNSDSIHSINRLAESITGNASQQRPQAATTLKPVSKKTLIFDDKNGKFELFEDLFHTMPKMQTEMIEARKMNHFHANLQNEALQKNQEHKFNEQKSLDDVLIVFQRKYVKPESPDTAVVDVGADQVGGGD